MRWRWWWVFVPVALGLIAALVILLTDVPNPVLYAQADLWILVLGTGIGLSILVAVIVAIFDRLEKTQIDATIQYAEGRRRFLQRLDHELKNPLTAILAGLANLSIAENFAERSASLSSVQTQVGRLRRLVAELRKLSELETRPLDLDTVDLTELLEDAFELTKDHPEVDERVWAVAMRFGFRAGPRPGGRDPGRSGLSWISGFSGHPLGLLPPAFGGGPLKFPARTTQPRIIGRPQLERSKTDGLRLSEFHLSTPGNHPGGT
jgi:two-component system OmpR family sensor kinase